MKYLNIFLVACATTSFLSPLYAQEGPALNVDPELLTFDFFERTEGAGGWSFRVKSPILVSALAYYDSGRDGLLHSHDVGIWRATQPSPPPTENFQGAALVTRQTIPAGQAASLDGPWRKVQLPSALTLEPGLYAISGSTTTDAPGDPGKTGHLYEFGIDTVDPNITLGAPGAGGGSFPAPEGWIWVADYGANMGPMFFVLTIPEPSSTVLGTLAVVVWVTRARQFMHPK